MMEIGDVWIRSEHDIPLVRQWTQRLSRRVKLSIGNQARLTTVVSQVSQSLFYYAKCVSVSFAVVVDEGEYFLQATIQEEEATEPVQIPLGIKLSRPELLRWLEGMHQFVQKFEIQAGEKMPVTVIAAKKFPSWQPTVSEETVKEWAESLKTEQHFTALESILQQNQDLARVLDDLREKESSLEQKIEEIEGLERLRDDLVHALVHDLRNPLASIRSALSGLFQNDFEELSEYQQAMIEISYQGVRQMGRLVDNILEVNKLETKTFEIEPHKLSFSDLMTGVMERQKSLADEKKIELAVDKPENGLEIEGDQKLLERLLQNLVDNAIKFTPMGGRVSLSASRRWIGKSGNGQKGRKPILIVQVRDTGPGINEDIRHHLFKKFAAGEGEESGTGIGLAFCKLAVQAHGGAIWFENHPGGGAVFSVLLPLTQDARMD